MNPARRGYALIAAVALAASLPALRNGFVYDDVAAVQNDARIHSLAEPARLLTMPYWDSDVRDRIYRPLTTFSFAADWAVGKGSALPFHLVNILLHLAVCLLVYRLARRVLGAGPGAFIAALWFAVHPVHVEVVAGIVGRSELIAALGYLAAVLAYRAEARESASAPGGARRALLAFTTMAAAVVAVGGKEHALTLPAGLLLMDAWLAHSHAERFGVVLRRHWVTWLGVTTVCVAFLAARAAVVGTAFGGGSVGAGLEGLDAGQRTLVMLPALLTWTRLFLFPVHLSADYSPNAFAPQATFGLAQAVALALVVLIASVAWRARHRMPAMLFGFGWVVVTASVALNIVVPTGVLLAERVLYLPSVGVAIVIGTCWERVYQHYWERRDLLVWAATAAILVLLAARTMSRIPAWQDGERFFAALVADAPESYRSDWAKGARAFERGAAAEGEQHYQRAIRTWPRDPAVVQELGERYLAAKLWGPADNYLTMAWTMDNGRADAAVQAVAARLAAGRHDSAAALGVAALRRFPEAMTLLVATAQAFEQLGNPRRALMYRRLAAWANPRQWQSLYIAADGALKAGRCDEARAWLGRAVNLAPAEQVLRDFRPRLESRCRGGP